MQIVSLMWGWELTNHCEKLCVHVLAGRDGLLSHTYGPALGWTHADASRQDDVIKDNISHQSVSREKDVGVCGYCHGALMIWEW